MVDKEVGNAHIFTPCKEQTEHGGGQQGPLYRALYIEQAEHKQEAHQGTHIHGAYGEGLFAPIEVETRGSGLQSALLENLLSLAGALVKVVVAGQVLYVFAVED